MGNPNQKEVSRKHEFFAILLLLIFFISPRIFHLKSFMDVDETIWLMRSANFYYAIGQRDFEGTHPNNTPGVIPMWAGTIGFLMEYPEYRGQGQGYFLKFTNFDSFLRESNVDPLDIVEKSRLVMITILGVSLGIGYWIARKMVGVLPALIGFMMISLDPWFLALSRINHLDAPQAVFQFVSLVAFIWYLFYDRKWVYLFLSGIMGGLAFLSRMPALLTIPAIMMIVAVEGIMKARQAGLIDRKAIFSQVSEGVRILFLWLLFFALVILIVWPFAFAHPDHLFEIFLHPSRFLPNASTLDPVASSSDLVEITADSDPQNTFSFGNTFRYIDGFLWKTTPVILAGVIMAGAAYIKKSLLFNDSRFRNLVRSLLIFAVIYTIAMTIPSKWSTRYYLPVHLTIDFISGIGWVIALDGFVPKWWKKRAKVLSSITLSAIVVIQIIDFAPSYPYYFPYFNPLLGGGKRAGETRFIGRGEGLDLAANYLNSKPEAPDLNVMSWYGVGPFSFFFNGTTTHLPVAATWGITDTLHLFDEIDYLVLYSNQWFRREPEGLFDLIEGIQPEHTIWINDIEYVRILKVSDIKKGLE